ncbi:hypothetical protein DRW41_14000 [Neobacillus piezotolerans]|uniref:C-type cytochrome biogenesis protein CcmI n=1 Tax=Neobacillus piezotolerans TaxID=2259171 RepID=A0A3D8GPE0_9BACI|nr:hypothetical protein [Neobacillus piezotolerans]RDU36141.1 hypothetical protein DRW41_14000 [Neobacillus piezotolerans]
MLSIILVCALLVAACLYLILAPFFGGRQPEQANGSEEGLDMKLVYEAVNELEMDALMGKISFDDFKKTKEAYYRAAAESIHEKRNVDGDILEALDTIRSEAKTAITGKNV